MMFECGSPGVFKQSDFSILNQIQIFVRRKAQGHTKFFQIINPIAFILWQNKYAIRKLQHRGVFNIQALSLLRNPVGIIWK